MEISYPDKKPFIEAAKKVQTMFAEKKGAMFTEFVEKIGAAAQ
jgi:hypothetical protein